ncbi:unnamed protein product [Brachionus calyciflorus]|uniref:MD-2-related lipid-recognition domain-containing protein n=1 Tax=Brachionus calyciflorus TaxID=104777 RepID=A0A813M4J5_9BILA|nr:unnamed protein product [Brachionus calyciflorus]
MLKSFLLLAILALTHLSNAQITWKDCGSKNGVVTSLEVEGCTATPCTLKKGTDASMLVKFNQKIASTGVSAKVSGVILGVPIPFPLPDGNGCNLSATCPASANSDNQVALKLPILNEYPSLSVDVRIQFLGDSNTNLVCFQFPVKISS